MNVNTFLERYIDEIDQDRFATVLLVAAGYDFNNGTKMTEEVYKIFHRIDITDKQLHESNQDPELLNTLQEIIHKKTHFNVKFLAVEGIETSGYSDAWFDLTCVFKCNDEILHYVGSKSILNKPYMYEYLPLFIDEIIELL